MRSRISLVGNRNAVMMMTGMSTFNGGNSEMISAKNNLKLMNH